jgi:hypothetical protein
MSVGLMSDPVKKVPFERRPRVSHQPALDQTAPNVRSGSISEVDACNCHVRFPPLATRRRTLLEVRFVPPAAEVSAGISQTRIWANSLFNMSVIAIVGELGIMPPAIRPEGATETNGKWRKN